MTTTVTTASARDVSSADPMTTTTQGPYRTTAEHGYIRHPGLPDDSDERRLMADIWNAVPPGWWDYYTEVADAFHFMNRRYKLGFNLNLNHNHRTLALLVDDFFNGRAERDDGWSVPWHRMRDRNGLIRSATVGVIVDPDEFGNRLFLAEGGRLSRGMDGNLTGSAAPARQFYIDRKVRDADWATEHLTEWVS